MKRLLLIIFCMAALRLAAQTRSTMATHYRDFKPSVITLKDGRQLKEGFTNVFLKNSSLLYLSGGFTKEANMANVVAVDFDDRKYKAIDGQLAWLIDSVGGNALLCVELFDNEAYERNLRNNVNITSLDIGDQMGYTVVDLNNEEDYKLPIFSHYYYLFDGRYVKVHERTLSKLLDKEQRTLLKRIVHADGFSWQDPQSLMKLLKAISSK